MVRRCWVNFQCRGVLLIWITVGQGLIVLAVCAGGGSLDIFSLIYLFSFLSPFLWETARYRLKYCLKGPFNQNNQLTNQPRFVANSSSCTTTELSKLLPSCLTTVKPHVIRYCEKAYEWAGKNFFWSIKILVTYSIN